MPSEPELYPPRSKGIGRGLLVIVLIAGVWFLADEAKRDYIVRAQVSSGLAMAYGVRNVLEQYLADHGELPAGNVDAGLPLAGENGGDYVSELGIEDGKIVIIYGNKANQKVHGKRLLYVPDVSSPAEVTWQCSSPDIPDKWLNEPCRSDAN